MEKTTRGPLVHLNGTDADRLLDDLRTFMAAVGAALEAMPRPHMRDYSPLPPAAWTAALDLLEERRRHLRALQDSVLEEWESIEAQEGCGRGLR